MDSPFKSEQTILSIGPGQLGIERGIESTGTRLRVAAYVEIETFIIANLIGLMEKGMVAPAPVWADLKTFDGRPFSGKVDGITAGYPCQPFSVAGNRKGTEDPRHLFPYLEKLIQTTRPLWCFFENVEGHLSLGLESVYQSLRDLGYTVEAGIYSAEEVGAPHGRKRVFILALDDSRYAECQRRQAAKKGDEDGCDSCDKSTPPNLPGRSGGVGKTLAISPSSGLGGEYTEGLQPETKRSSEGEMEHAKRGRSGELGNKSSQGKGYGASGRSELLQSGHVSDPLCVDGFKKWNDAKAGIVGKNGTRWPVPPGRFQHEWEESRTIESSVGCTIDGYNFREDLLRMFGNGVVEQTAAKAWVNLWNKFLDNQNHTKQ